MKIYLAQNQLTACIFTQGFSEFYPKLNLYPRSNCEHEKQFCENLHKRFKEERESNISGFQLKIKLITNNDVSCDEFQSGGKVRVIDTNGILKSLSNLLNDRNMKVVLKLSCRGPETSDDRFDFHLHTTVMPLTYHPSFVCKDDNVKVPDSFNRIGLIGRWFLSIAFTFSHPNFEKKLTCENVEQKMSICQKILHEEIACDVVIITKEGSHVNCHKSFLLAHSSVFSAMFQSGMKEDRTSVVEMPDMTEDGVRALLAYLYHWDLTKPKEKCFIAFELLNASHKYDIPKLEAVMTELLLFKSHVYYDTDVAVKLFLFARNLPSGDDLKMKAVKVMKEYLCTLEQCPSYQELFKENHQVAMELCKYAFTA